MNQIWEEIRRILSKSLTSTAMETWFSGCKILEINDTEAVFVAADEFRKSVIEKRFTSSLKDALKELKKVYFFSERRAERTALCGLRRAHHQR